MARMPRDFCKDWKSMWSRAVLRRSGVRPFGVAGQATFGFISRRYRRSSVAVPDHSAWLRMNAAMAVAMGSGVDVNADQCGAMGCVVSPARIALTALQSAASN